MELTLNSGDLAKGVNKKKLPMSVKFEDLNSRAQAAVRIVRRGTYHSGDRHNAIYPPD
jgi:hypothetical protein